jgi:hypothetical protein
MLYVYKRVKEMERQEAPHVLQKYRFIALNVMFRFAIFSSQLSNFMVGLRKIKS